MLKIGITGGIGTGKTMVCRVFEVLKVPVFYADAEAKAAMQNDPDLIEGLKKAFGKKTYSAVGKLNRSYLASIVFNNDEALKQLNALVHPTVFKAFDTWVLRQEKAFYVVKEAALLFESNSYKDCNYSILISSPPELRIPRIMNRDKITEKQVLARINKQMPEDEKAKMADFVILNNEKDLIIPQVLRLNKQFSWEAKFAND